MLIQELAAEIEVNFWNAILPVMESEGIIMKLTRYLYRLVHRKGGYLFLLIIVWGAVGFVSGLLIGRILTILL